MLLRLPRRVCLFFFMLSLIFCKFSWLSSAFSRICLYVIVLLKVIWWVHITGSTSKNLPLVFYDCLFLWVIQARELVSPNVCPFPIVSVDEVDYLRVFNLASYRCFDDDLFPIVLWVVYIKHVNSCLKYTCPFYVAFSCLCIKWRYYVSSSSVTLKIPWAVSFPFVGCDHWI